MTDRAERRRNATIALFVFGAIAIFVNAFGQEALGWDFLPGGLVGALLLGLGVNRWMEDRRRG